MSGFSVIALESERPSVIRRKAVFSEVVYRGRVTIEGITAYRADEESVEKVLEECGILV